MSPLERLQYDTELFLLSHEELELATVWRVRPRSAGEATGIETKIQQMLNGMVQRNGKLGVSISILMPVLTGVESNVRSVSGGIGLDVDVIENVMVNMGPQGTQISAEAYALRVAQLLHHMSFGGSQPLVGEPQMITPQPEMVLDKKVVYRVSLKAHFPGERRAKVATPSIIQTGAQITLNKANAEEEIWWTNDGSLPGPANENANRYGEPFSLPVGTHCLRVAAYARCAIGSNVREQTVVVE